VKPKAVFASGDFVWAHPYCVTINRVIAGGTLNKIADHWYCCGESGGEYFNNLSKEQVFLNLWYVVKTAIQKMTDGKGKTSDALQGVTFGVQWSLLFDGTKTPTFFVTDTWSPVT
jgi:competence protein ComEC